MREHGLFAGLFARGEAAAETSDRAFLQAMLDVEVALLWALVRAQAAPPEAAEGLAAAASADALDLDELGRSAAEAGTPVPAMLRALRERLPESAAAHLHQGATSQDVLDTAMMLVARRALVPALEDLRSGAAACVTLAERHRDTLLPARTLLQQAPPVSFALKAATWLTALDDVRRELSVIRAEVLSLQLGGPVGTLAALGDHGLEIIADMSLQLELAEPELPWHTIRLPVTRLAAALGGALGVMGKVARDIALMAQTEVAEAKEGGGPERGGSSTMPHKRNPVGSIAVLACAQRGPGLVATIFGSMLQEHERAAGAWQAEWEPTLELLRLTGSAATSLRETLEGLEVDPQRMRQDLELTGGLILSEGVASALADELGRAHAQQLVADAARRSVGERRGFREVLLEREEVRGALGEARLDEALDPERNIGAAGRLIDRALAAHRARS